MSHPPRPLCFVAMPFGRKPINPGGPDIDFDRIYEAIRRGVEQAQVDCRRADYDPSGGFIHRSMFEALNLNDGDAVARLAELQDEVLGEPYVEAQLHSSLMAIYLGFREKKAYRKMVDLFARLPKVLQHATVVLEQLALAQNRLAEAAEEDGDKGQAAQLREEALYCVGRISENEITSETYGILGRIHKGRYDAALEAEDDLLAQGELNQAIEAYEKGLLQDPRDYYPGVNSVTLRLARGSAEDEARLKSIVPVVRFAIERAAAPAGVTERYWRTATELELACAERDWKSAQAGLAGLLTLNVDQWMRETTAKNLKLQKRARKDETRTVKNLEKYMQALSPQ